MIKPSTPQRHLLVALLLPSLGVARAAFPEPPPVIERISVPYPGAAEVANGSVTFTPAVSGDGRYVAFESGSDSLVPGDRNRFVDVFVRDRLDSTTERVSVTSAGFEGQGGSTSPCMSADGRYVVFRSTAELAPPTPDGSDVYIRDRLLGTTQRVVISNTGARMIREPSLDAISGDGRFLVFSSLEDTLVVGDTNGSWDIFVRDLVLQTTERVSRAWNGAQGLGHSHNAAISYDGRFVAFYSEASNLVPNDTNGFDDIFVRDRVNATTERANVSSSNAQANTHTLGTPSISADGRYVCFATRAANLVPNPSQGKEILVRDRLTGSTTRVSQSPAGQGSDGSDEPTISGDGRLVAFRSSPHNLTSDPDNGMTQVFVSDRVTGTIVLVSSSAAGGPANFDCRSPVISSDGRHVVFASIADNLSPGDIYGSDDVFLTTLDPGSPPPPPAAPTNLTATAASSTQVDLTWADNSDNETAFEIQRVTGTSFATGSSLAESSAATHAGTGQATYSDAGLQPGTAYTYRVRATNAGGSSAWSDERSATTPPTPTPARIDIVAARMTGSHWFTVTTRQTAPDGGIVSVTVPFPGRIQPTLTATVGPGTTTTSIPFDLQNLGVSRFAANLRMRVAAALTRSGQLEAGSFADVAIPLPVVTVHGILSPQPHFTALEDRLIARSMAAWPISTSYARSGETYQTIYAFSWGSTTRDTLADGARRLHTYMEQVVRRVTWADKAYVIGHSRGANLVRWFISSALGYDRGGKPYTAGAVLACMPATGGILYLGARPTSVAPQAVLTPLSALDVRPVWPWTRLRARMPFRPSANNALNTLNNRMPPPSRSEVDLLVLYGIDSRIKDTANTATGGATYTFVRGDGWVTEFSARGILVTPSAIDPNQLSERTVPWFQNVASEPMPLGAVSGFGGLHTAFLNDASVQDRVFDWINGAHATR